MTGTDEATLRRLFEDMWNGDDPTTADELVHEADTIHDRDLADELRSPELYRVSSSRVERDSTTVECWSA